jgi:hypothetical protein
MNVGWQLPVRLRPDSLCTLYMMVDITWLHANFYTMLLYTNSINNVPQQAGSCSQIVGSVGQDTIAVQQTGRFVIESNQRERVPVASG